MAAALLGAAVTADDGVELGPGIYDFVRSPLDLERSVSAFEYAASTTLTEVVTVPGSAPPETVVRGRTHLLMFLRRWFEWVLTVHRHGYSLRGQFTAAMFRVGTGLRVKISGHVHLFHYTRHNGGMDYTALVSSMEDIMTMRESVPPHLRVWLDLIAEGVNGYEYLIRYHTSLMEPRQAFDFVLEGRSLLDQLRGVNPYLHSLILSWHPQFIDWDVDSYCVNSYMAAARDHEDPYTGLPFSVVPDLTGVLTLGRNCSVHPARYLKEFMVLIFEDDFPGAVARFQLSLFRAGLLPIFRLEVTMA